MRMHHTLTPERIAGAVARHHQTLDDPGFCVACGEEAQGVEPDGRRYRCDSCGSLSVYGAEELLIRTVA